MGIEAVHCPHSKAQELTLPCTPRGTHSRLGSYRGGGDVSLSPAEAPIQFGDSKRRPGKREFSRLHQCRELGCDPAERGSRSGNRSGRFLRGCRVAGLAAGRGGRRAGTSGEGGGSSLGVTWAGGNPPPLPPPHYDSARSGGSRALRPAKKCLFRRQPRAPRAPALLTHAQLHHVGVVGPGHDQGDEGHRHPRQHLLAALEDVRRRHLPRRRRAAARRSHPRCRRRHQQQERRLLPPRLCCGAAPAPASHAKGQGRPAGRTASLRAAAQQSGLGEEAPRRAPECLPRATPSLSLPRAARRSREAQARPCLPRLDGFRLRSLNTCTGHASLSTRGAGRLLQREAGERAGSRGGGRGSGRRGFCKPASRRGAERTDFSGGGQRARRSRRYSRKRRLGGRPRKARSAPLCSYERCKTRPLYAESVAELGRFARGADEFLTLPTAKLIIHIWYPLSSDGAQPTSLVLTTTL